MQYFKLYEEWNPLEKKRNIYALLGQNLQNYLTQRQLEIKKSKYFEEQFFKDLTALTAINRAKTINVKDVFTLIDNFFKNLLKKLEPLTDISDMQDIHKLAFQYMSLFVLEFRFDTAKMASFLHNDIWFSFYKITDPKSLKNIDTAISQRWLKISHDDSKTKSLLSTELSAELKNWQKAFSDERVLKFRDLTKYTIKPDEQQSESENKINDFNTNVDNESLTKIEKFSEHDEEKIKHISEFTEFKPDFLKRFDQPGLPGSHKMMKKWFLEAFAKAEKDFGSSLIITSGIRTPEYQKYLTSLGYKTAKKNSPHIEGVAADISIINLDVNKLIAAFEKVGFTRFGIGKSFLHVDLGDQLNPKIWIPYSRWTYNY